MKKTININLFYANGDKEAVKKYNKLVEAIKAVLKSEEHNIEEINITANELTEEYPDLFE